eukprot:9726878-Alexandrium_andersonii.AAC.1
MQKGRRGTHPLGASRAHFEADPEPAQLQCPAREVILRFTYGGLRIEADCSRDGPWAVCGLHFGRPAQ